LRDRQSFVHRAFSIGLILLAAEESFRGLSYGAVLPETAMYWQKRVVAASVFIPAVWLAFSLSYARVNAEKLLRKWKWTLVAIGVMPIPFLALFRKSLYIGAAYLESSNRWSILMGWPARAIQLFLLCTSIVILVNLERTLRSSTGRLRWQIKFLALGVALLFGTRIYLASQQLLFSIVDTGFVTTGAVALIAANLLFALSLMRGSSLNVDVYLSTTAIQNSLTVVLAGIYLLAVGALARVTSYFSRDEALPLDAFLVFVSIAVLAVLLLSERLRRKLRLFVSSHFHRPVYDYRKVWMELTQRTTSMLDIHELSNAVSRIVSESVNVLSVNVWLVDESQRRLKLCGSTAISHSQAKELESAGKSASELIAAIRHNESLIDFTQREFAWTKEIMSAAPEFFRDSQLRYAIALHAGGELLGLLTLNDDRVGREPLTTEDMVLLEAFASQLASSLLNLRLSARLRHAKEVETFQTVSTFFVHDLKNLASRLSLTMQNLPANFDNPEFRADALRVMSSSVAKIDAMCQRLAMLKQDIELKPLDCDLQSFVAATLTEFKSNLKAELQQNLQPVPKVCIDAEQIQKVLTNLIMNANEAVNGDGVIQVRTLHEGNTVGFAVRDNGCGMSEEFIEKSLFRPFQTTKKKGLGIGLFHSKLIVEAHRGTLEVSSAVGAGTEFRVILPVA